MQTARSYLKEHDFEKANGEFLQIHKQNPKAGTALIGLAGIALRQDDSALARQYCEQAMKDPESRVQALLMLARIEQ